MDRYTRLFNEAVPGLIDFRDMGPEETRMYVLGTREYDMLNDIYETRKWKEYIRSMNKSKIDIEYDSRENKFIVRSY